MSKKKRIHRYTEEKANILNQHHLDKIPVPTLCEEQSPQPSPTAPKFVGGFAASSPAAALRLGCWGPPSALVAPCCRQPGQRNLTPDELRSSRTSVFYNWQKELFARAAQVLGPNGRAEQRSSQEAELKRTISTLETKLAKKNDVIAEISQEYVVKKELGEP